MLAEILATFLALTSAGTPRAEASPENAPRGLGLPPRKAQARAWREATASPENSARARRGLLPRKAAVRVRSAPRLRHIVLLPPAPTWLGEPGEVAPAEESVAEARIEPVADPLEPASATDLAPFPPRWVAVEGVHVAAVVTRRGDPVLRAAVEEAEVQVFVRRRPGRRN